MPVYVYRCEGCGSQFEKRQSFSDAPLTECEACHGTLRKVLSPAAVIFKGSGFYITDNHGSSGNGRNGSASKDDTGKVESSSSGESKGSTEPKEPVKSSTSAEN